MASGGLGSRGLWAFGSVAVHALVWTLERAMGSFPHPSAAAPLSADMCGDKVATHSPAWQGTSPAEFAS